MAEQQYGHLSRTAKRSLWRWLVLLLVVLWGLAVLMWTLQRIGNLVGHHPMLGESFVAFGRH